MAIADESTQPPRHAISINIQTNQSQDIEIARYSIVIVGNSEGAQLQYARMDKCKSKSKNQPTKNKFR